MLYKLETKTGLLLLFVKYRYISIFNTMQYMHKAKYALLHHDSSVIKPFSWCVVAVTLPI